MQELSEMSTEQLQMIANLTESRVMKISKDDLSFTEEVLLWSPELEKEIVGYWTTLNGYWKAKTIPKCTCADHEGGFLAKEPYNPYFLDGEPCNIKVYERFKEAKDEVEKS